MRSYALLALATLPLAVSPVAAQADGGPDAPKKGSRYVPFAFDPKEVEKLTQFQLEAAEQKELLKGLVDKILRDPKKFKLDPKTLQGLNLNDPALQEQFKGILKDIPKGKEPSPEVLKKLGDELQKNLLKGQPTNENGPVPLPGHPPPALPPPPKHPAAPPNPDPEAPALDWLKRLMERAEESKVGDRLRDSPAWHDALLSLRTSLHQAPQSPDGWGLDKLTGRLLSPDKLPLPDARTLQHLGNLKPPNLPHWKLPLPSLANPGLGPVSAPALPTAAALGTVAVWLVLVALVAVLLWQASRWLKATGQRNRAAEAGLGPWPIAPDRIATRAELVRAFDYLALLVFGTPARAWHHHAVARALAERSAPLADAAGQAAALYEWARYTEGDEALPADRRDRARRALAQLAGMHAA
jgi:hypothetical protein